MAFRKEKKGIELGRRRRAGPRAAVALVLAVLFGALAPHLLARRIPSPAGEPADAIFVLTGGENRIGAGYAAWREGVGRELYILGAWREVSPDRILPGRPALSPEEAERIHVEGWSENTLENAFSAKAIATKRRFRRVVLVTSDYHMPRAAFILGTVLPGSVSLAAVPVRSEWRGSRAVLRSLRHFFVEGWKYWAYRVFLLWE